MSKKKEEIPKGSLFICYFFNPMKGKEQDKPAEIPLMEYEGVFYHLHYGRKPYNIGVEAPKKPRVNQAYKKTRRKLKIDKFRNNKPANFVEK